MIISLVFCTKKFVLVTKDVNNNAANNVSVAITNFLSISFIYTKVVQNYILT